MADAREVFGAGDWVGLNRLLEAGFFVPKEHDEKSFFGRRVVVGGEMIVLLRDEIRLPPKMKRGGKKC